MRHFPEFFLLGMKRTVGGLAEPPDFGLHLNLGCGQSEIPGAIGLELPDWNYEDGIPYADGSIACIHAYHFLEHLPDVVMMLRECQRVLMPSGVMNICVPYYGTQLMAQDITHHHSFCAETWQQLFRNSYYSPAGIAEPWKFRVGFNLICGIVDRNVCLLTQLIRE